MSLPVTSVRSSDGSKTFGNNQVWPSESFSSRAALRDLQSRVAHRRTWRRERHPVARESWLRSSSFRVSTVKVSGRSSHETVLDVLVRELDREANQLVDTLNRHLTLLPELGESSFFRLRHVERTEEGSTENNHRAILLVGDFLLRNQAIQQEVSMVLSLNSSVSRSCTKYSTAVRISPRTTIPLRARTSALRASLRLRPEAKM